jgi:hypothetical protein
MEGARRSDVPFWYNIAMAKATWEGKECNVRVDSDLESNWSVSILSGEFDPVSLIKRPAAPIVMKVRAKSRWLALDTSLRALKAQGKITDYTIEPRPAEEIAAEEAEKAKKKAARAAPAEEEESDA